MKTDDFSSKEQNHFLKKSEKIWVASRRLELDCGAEHIPRSCLHIAKVLRKDPHLQLILKLHDDVF